VIIPRRVLFTSFVALSLAICSTASAQSPSAIYSWDGSPNVEQWARSFGATDTSMTLDNTTPGVLTLTETSVAAGGSQAFSDGFNRVREAYPSSAGGLDLTGLDYLEFDIGHNGSAPINAQFYVQATPGSAFVALGPDLTITPGVNTYQVPLAGLTPAQQVYVRTIGVNTRDHAALGNVTWTVGEVRSGGIPLTQRDLITHDAGTPEGGLQGALVNFDQGAVLGNNGGQNQTGLSWNSAGTGSLQWTDVGGSNGAAISWGNGTALNGNTFNNRPTDLSNYTSMLIRISALDASNPTGTLDFNSFFQTNNFQFQPAEGGASRTIVTDGSFQEFVFSLAGLNDMSVVDQTGINLFAHPSDLTINVDLIQFNTVPEPTSALLLLGGACAGLMRRRRAA
jgi:hypothetical protein